jgi:hypothetical protein
MGDPWEVLVFYMPMAFYKLSPIYPTCCWTTERGGVNQLLPCLNNYAYFKLFAEHLMTITIMQGGKQ